METLPDENFPRIAACEPFLLKTEPGKVYSWCTCGLSEKQPLCDSAHKNIEGMPYRSIKIKFEKEEEVRIQSGLFMDQVAIIEDIKGKYAILKIPTLGVYLKATLPISLLQATSKKK